VLQRALTATNAAKAVVAIMLNACIDFVEAFGLYDFTDEQQQALSGLVNAALLAYVLATYKWSHKRDDRAAQFRV
jgi:hypothetical protein